MAVWSLATVLLLAAVSPPLQAQNYTPLEGLRVSDGRVQFLFASAVGRQCIRLSSINGVVYTAHTSKWQRRAGATWVDIPGTEREVLCSYSPTSPGEYRLVAEISIDGERGFYSSENTLTVEGEEIPELEPVTTLYFPDYVDGGGWSVQLAVSNIDTTTPATVSVTASDQEGQPVPELFDSEADFEILPLGNRILRSTGVGEVRRGWIEVRTDTESVRGLLTYRHSETGVEVSVEPVDLGDHFALFVEESSDIGTGLAIFKPDPSSTIEFRIYSEDGSNPLGVGLARVGDFNQVARTIPEWFDADGIDTEFLKDFRGLLFLQAEDGASFAPLGLRFGKRTGSLSAVPVVRVTEVSEMGLNTSLTDPNGQWTATAKAKIIEKNDTYWEFSYFVDMTNRTGEEQKYTVKIHFVDADGFSVEDSYTFNEIPARSTKRLLDRALIDTENAPTVVGIRLEVKVR